MSKSSRESKKSGVFRKDWAPKRRKPPNKWALESETEKTVSAAKKLKSMSVSDVLVPEDDTLNYRILNFNSVFNEISQVENVKCAEVT